MSEELKIRNQQILDVAVANASEIFHLERQIEVLKLTVEQLQSRLRAEELVQAIVDKVYLKIRRDNERLRLRLKEMWLEHGSTTQASPNEEKTS